MPNLYIYGNKRFDNTLRFFDGFLEFQSTDRIRKIELIKIDSIVIFGDIHITRDCMQKLLIERIPVLFLSAKGNYFGKLVSTNNTNIDIQRLQFKRGEDKNFCLEFSKNIIKGKIKNQCNFICKKNEKYINPLPYIKAISIRDYEEKIEMSSSIEELKDLEKEIDRLYFSALSYFLENKFPFTERTKIPPKDPFNSLISLGYTLLIYEIQNILDSKGLNSYAGFFNKDDLELPALCVDLMEEWRTTLVDYIAFKLLEKNEITGADFEYIEENGACLLKIKALHLFIDNFSNHLKNNSGIILNGINMSYRRAIEYQILKLTLAIKNNNPNEYIAALKIYS